VFASILHSIHTNHTMAGLAMSAPSLISIGSQRKCLALPLANHTQIPDTLVSILGILVKLKVPGTSASCKVLYLFCNIDNTSCTSKWNVKHTCVIGEPSGCLTKA
ncbi:uncharacterized protein VICG_02093, partial [Vittaforma corneae ATCC 50505]